MLTNFRNYRRSVLFPKIVVSAFAGFVLYLCHDFGCLITGSKFWYRFKSSSVFFSVGGRKILLISSFLRGIVSSGSCRSFYAVVVLFSSVGVYFFLSSVSME